MKSRVLNAEMRLRASLAREESRGRHYRADFPYRNDDDFLCYILLKKGDDGNMEVEKEELPDYFIGDTSMAYEDRYLRVFPGEADAVGFEDPNLSDSERTELANAQVQEEIA